MITADAHLHSFPSCPSWFSDDHQNCRQISTQRQIADESFTRRAFEFPQTKPLQMVLNKAARCSFLPLSCRTVDESFECSDNTLFSATLNNPDHVLHFLLPLPKVTGHNLYIYYYAEAANSGQNHTVQHNTAQSPQIKKGTYIHSN